ncbi:MAG: hypothetical protein FJ271_03100 [Planctomycetes bacterium]|nr:hypothetical protein [Planctomycetota bacterium]
MLPETGQTIPWTELPPSRPESPVAREWETYRREVGRLLAEGEEGRFALIHGDDIVGIFDTWEEAEQAGLERYLLQAHMVRPILSREPVLRGPRFFRRCQS